MLLLSVSLVVGSSDAYVFRSDPFDNGNGDFDRCRGREAPDYDLRLNTTNSSHVFCERRPCNPYGEVNLEEPGEVADIDLSACMECNPAGFGDRPGYDLDLGECVTVSCSNRGIREISRVVHDDSHAVNKKRANWFFIEEGRCDGWHCGSNVTRRSCMLACGVSAHAGASLFRSFENRQSSDCCDCHDECDPKTYEGSTREFDSYCKRYTCSEEGLVQYEVFDLPCSMRATSTITSDSTTEGNSSPGTVLSSTRDQGTAPATPSTTSIPLTIVIDEEKQVQKNALGKIVVPGAAAVVIVSFRDAAEGGSAGATPPTGCTTREEELRILMGYNQVVGECSHETDPTTGHCISLMCVCEVGYDECHKDTSEAVDYWAEVTSVAVVRESSGMYGSAHGLGGSISTAVLAVVAVSAVAAALA